MDGVLSAAADLSSANLFGILYAEDFDDPADPDGARPPDPPPPPLTQADVDVACAAAVRAARLEWQAGLERARLDAVTALGTVLTGMRDATERSALAMAEGTILTVLSMVGGLLPHFSRELGDAEVRALLALLLPSIRSQDRINVRVHPDLVADVQRDVTALDPASSAMIDVVAAPLERGDVKVTWENGSMTRDTRQIAQAVQDILSQLGLHRPLEAPAKRSMAHAD